MLRICDHQEKGARWQMKTYPSFKEFYPFYLSKHQNPVNRGLHVIGSLLVLSILAYGVFTPHWKLLFLMSVVGYGFAWIGHYFFEKNRPATFTYPLYSFIGDWAMLKDVLTGRVGIRPNPD